MTIICPYCQTEMPTKDYDAHTAHAHPEQAERRALLSIESAEKQVEYIYEHYPETKQDNGLLLLYFAKGYPKLKLYEEGNDYVIKALYDDFFYFLKRANSITRLGRHIRQPKKTGEELIAYSNPLKTSIKTKDAVKQVLEQIPQARYNEGLLAEKVLRYFQPQGVEMQYNKDTQEITLKAPKSLMLAVLRHIETISRRSREYREANPFTESPKAVERETEYTYSTKEWAERGGNGWLPNTYVPMRD